MRRPTRGKTENTPNTPYRKNVAICGRENAKKVLAQQLTRTVYFEDDERAYGAEFGEDMARFPIENYGDRTPSELFELMANCCPITGITFQLN